MRTRSATFYVRYEHRVIAFFMRAVGRGDLAADLTAETFASLVESAERYDPALGQADGWLFGIARNVLARSRERGRVEDRARRSIGLGVLALDDEAIERIEATAGGADATLALQSLPEDQRDAVIERVVNERGYAGHRERTGVLAECRAQARQPRSRRDAKPDQGDAMTPLLPDLERQLRRAVRDRQAEQPAKRPARPKRRAMAAVAAAAAIAIAAVIVLAAGIGAGPSLSEAQALERAADAAERGLAAPTLAPGEYWYVRSVTAGTTGYRALGSPALIQSRQTTEIWQSTDGSGRERSVNDGLPLFFGTPVARARFRREEARAPKPVPVDELLPHSTGFRSPLGILTYGQVQALPSTPDRDAPRDTSRGRTLPG